MHLLHEKTRTLAILLVGATSLGAWSAVGLALVDIRASVGTSQSNYQNTADGTGEPVADSDDNEFTDKGTQTSIALDLAPLMGVPLAFGGFYSMTNAKGTLSSGLGTKINSGRGGLDVVGWVPMPKLRPYFRLGYYLFGQENITVTDIVVLGQDATVKYPLKVSGYQLGVGVGFSVLPMISVFAEYTMDKYTLTGKKTVLTIGDSIAETADSPENRVLTNNASAISVGLGLSI